MKIKKLTLNNFMAFENAEINWSDNINIICGENSTGKTTLLKVMYSLIKPLSSGGKDNLTKEMEEQVFVKKIQGVFRPDEMKIGRLVSRKQGSNRTEFSIDLEKKQKISVGFGNRQENHADVSIIQEEKTKKYDVIYIPTKEMISTVEHFVSLYDEYHIDFESFDEVIDKLEDDVFNTMSNVGCDCKNALDTILREINDDLTWFLEIQGNDEYNPCVLFLD